MLVFLSEVGIGPGRSEVEPNGNGVDSRVGARALHVNVACDNPTIGGLASDETSSAENSASL